MKHQLSRKFYRYVLPSMISMLLSGFYSMVDGVFVGNAVGSQALAAINLVYPVQACMNATAFGLGVGGAVLLAAFICPWSLLLLALFAVIIFIDASIRNKSIKIGALSVIAAFIQLTGYGSGFLRAWWKRCICGGKSFSAFEKTFYK